MKRILLFLTATILLLCFAMTSCSSPEKEDVQDTQQERVDEKENVEEKKDAEPTEDPQMALDNEQTLEYLALLGLDETCNYELNDTFPSGIENKSSYLVNVTNITEDDFAAIEDALEAGGFAIISDIMTDEEIKTRIYQYSNNDSIYLEIVFSYEMQYFDVIFMPIS